MKNKVLGKCPVCNSQTIITEISCNSCNTTIKGKFALSKFSRLSDDEQYFIEMFIKNRGSIKEMEKELNISYPTVKNKLEEVRNALGFTRDKAPSVNKKEILEQLSKGEISKDKALKMLSK